MTEDAKPNVIKAFCSSCGGQRNCDVVGEHIERHEDNDVWSEKSWRILTCRGCDDVFCQTVYVFSEEYDYRLNEFGETEQEYIEKIAYWPPPSISTQPEWVHDLHTIDIKYTKLIPALDELYGALNSNLPMLAGVAVRVCFDICADVLGVDPSLTFSGKINELAQIGRLDAAAVKRVATAIDAGHAATHRGWIPEPDALRTLVDVLEEFINDTVIEPSRKAKIDQRTAELQSRIPPKHRKKRTPKAIAGASEEADQKG